MRRSIAKLKELLTLEEVEEMIELMTLVRNRYLRKNWEKERDKYCHRQFCPLCEKYQVCSSCPYKIIYRYFCFDVGAPIPDVDSPFSVAKTRRAWIDYKPLRVLKRVQEEHLRTIKAD